MQVARSEPPARSISASRAKSRCCRSNGANIPHRRSARHRRARRARSGALEEIAQKLVEARNPFVVVSGSGRTRRRCRRWSSCASCSGMPVDRARLQRRYQCFPMSASALPGQRESQGRRRGAGARSRRAVDAGRQRRPARRLRRGGRRRSGTSCASRPIEFTANLRHGRPIRCSRSARIAAAAKGLLSASDRSASPTARDAGRKPRAPKRAEARGGSAGASAKTPIDPMWLSRIRSAKPSTTTCSSSTRPCRQPLERVPALAAAGLVLPQSRQQRRLGARRRVRRQARRARPRRGRR